MVKQYKGSKNGLFFTPDEALCEWLHHAQQGFDHAEWADLMYAFRHPHKLGVGVVTRHDVLVELVLLGLFQTRYNARFPNSKYATEKREYRVVCENKQIHPHTVCMDIFPNDDDDGGDDTDTENRHIQPHDEGMVKKWYDFTHDDHKKDDDDV